MHVFNQVGALRLQGQELSLNTTWNFHRILKFLEKGKHKEAILTCKDMVVSPE
jgi:hypothetical protein